MTSPVDTGRLTLADGTVLSVRPIEPGDADRLVRFHHGLSDQTTYLRFFTVHPNLHPSEVERFTNVDHVDREAVVAVLDGEIVAVARFDALGDSGDAEVAFVVADELQGRRIGAALLQELADRARARGLRRFVAETLPHNHRMLAVFRHAAMPVESRFVDGVVTVTLEL
jgi:RimJ/RimL family protein N-acetyltransferase